MDEVTFNNRLNQSVDESNSMIRHELESKIKDVEERINNRISALENSMTQNYLQNKSDLHAVEKTIINSINEIKLENGRRDLDHFKEQMLLARPQGIREGQAEIKLDFTNKIVMFFVGAFVSGGIGIIFQLVKNFL